MNKYYDNIPKRVGTNKEIFTSDLDIYWLPSVLFDPVPAITGILPFASFIQSSITFSCSSWFKVGDSPVVPAGTKPLVPFSRWKLISFKFF